MVVVMKNPCQRLSINVRLVVSVHVGIKRGNGNVSSFFQGKRLGFRVKTNPLEEKKCQFKLAE